jgi:hypothetical protein
MAITSLTSRELTSKNTGFTITSLTANTYATIISIQGSGFANYLKFQFQVNSTALTFKLTIDGNVFATAQLSSTTAGATYFWTFNEGGSSPLQAGSQPNGFVFPHYKKSFLLEVSCTSSQSNASLLVGNTYYTIQE